MATSKKERVFSLVMALLFLASASALIIALIVQHYQNQSTNASQTASQQNLPNQQAKANNCSETSVPANKSPLPSTYKPSGTVTALQTTDLTVGSGKTAKAGDCLQVQYYGTLASNGTVFDEDFDKGTALQFPLGEGQVIKGWDEGVVGMKVGGTRRLVIPAALAYGSQSPSSAIPPNSALVFVVKLLAIK